MLKNSQRQLPHQGLTVAMSLARNHEIGILNHIIKTNLIQEKFSPRTSLSIEILQESIAQTSGRTCSGNLTPIISEMLGAYLGKLPRPIIQHLHHLCIGSLLRRKDVSRPVFATERIGNIRSQHKTAFLADFLPVVAHRLEHSDAAIGCGAAAQAHDETAHAPAISIHNHLAHAPGSSLHRVALFRLNQSQSCGLRNLDNRRIIHDSVFSLNPSHQRIMGMNPHSLSLHRRKKSIEHSLSPITHFQGNDFGRSIIWRQFLYFGRSLISIPFLHSRSNRLIHLTARKATFIRVASNYYLLISSPIHQSEAIIFPIHILFILYHSKNHRLSSDSPFSPQN